ncbi:hypothetical protein BD560DRAFT_441716 [Blakeslea trispora]|nr:hypothetical protein BD560DRAFT_441716 [Blakeslea trispora]
MSDNEEKRKKTVTDADVQGGAPPKNTSSDMDISDDFELEDFSVSGSVSGSIIQEKGSVGDSLTALRGQMAKVIADYSRARLAQDDKKADDYLVEIQKLKLGIKSLVECQAMLGNIDTPMTPTVVKSGSGSSGLSLSRRDLPKYQLLSNSHKPFPNEEAFESDEHFLRTFENVIDSSSQEIELVWKRYIPLCLPFGNDAWTQTTLINCTTWSEARNVFKRHCCIKCTT